MKNALSPPMLLLAAGLFACTTGVDKDRPPPEPAVGRSFDGTDTSAERNREASHPIRPAHGDSTRTDTTRGTP